MRKLRIAVWHNLPSGGGKRALYHHVKGLLQRGHTVESWCPPTADQTFMSLSEIIRENVVPLLPDIPVPWMAKPSSNALQRLVRLYRDVVEKSEAMTWHCEKCAEQINDGNYDVLFGNACMFFGTSQIGRFVTIPKVIYLGEPNRLLYEAMPQLPWVALPESEGHWWKPSNIKNSLKDSFRVKGLRLQAREELTNAKSFDLILVNSFFSRESILRTYGLESKVCYLGIDTELFRKTERPRENLVVGLGSITRGKRPDRAIRALGTIDKEFRPNLAWIGNLCDWHYRRQVEELAASHGVNFVVEMQLSDEEIVDYLNRATAVLYTSQLEPFGFAPLEANACGTPVVAIAEGGVRESLRDGVTGYLVDSDDPVAIGNAILRLLKEPDMAREMGEAARVYVHDHWNWESAIDRLENYFLTLVSRQD